MWYLILFLNFSYTVISLPRPLDDSRLTMHKFIFTRFNDFPVTNLSVIYKEPHITCTFISIFDSAKVNGLNTSAS